MILAAMIYRSEVAMVDKVYAIIAKGWKCPVCGQQRTSKEHKTGNCSKYQAKKYKSENEPRNKR